MRTDWTSYIAIAGRLINYWALRVTQWNKEIWVGQFWMSD